MSAPLTVLDGHGGWDDGSWLDALDLPSRFPSRRRRDDAAGAAPETPDGVDSAHATRTDSSARRPRVRRRTIVLLVLAGLLASGLAASAVVGSRQRDAVESSLSSAAGVLARRQEEAGRLLKDRTLAPLLEDGDRKRLDARSTANERLLRLKNTEGVPSDTLRTRTERMKTASDATRRLVSRLRGKAEGALLDRADGRMDASLEKAKAAVAGAKGDGSLAAESRALETAMDTARKVRSDGKRTADRLDDARASLDRATEALSRAVKARDEEKARKEAEAEAAAQAQAQAQAQAEAQAQAQARNRSRSSVPRYTAPRYTAPRRSTPAAPSKPQTQSAPSAPAPSPAPQPAPEDNVGSQIG